MYTIIVVTRIYDSKRHITKRTVQVDLLYIFTTWIHVNIVNFNLDLTVTSSDLPAAPGFTGNYSHMQVINV